MNFIQTAYAQIQSQENLKTTIPNPFSVGSSLPELFTAIVEKVLLPVGGVLAVVAFIWTGFLFVKAQGNPEELKTARNALLYTAIGTAILLGAEVLAKVIEATIGGLS